LHRFANLKDRQVNPHTRNAFYPVSNSLFFVCVISVICGYNFMTTADTSSVHYRACNLCEAICGIEITVQEQLAEPSPENITAQREAPDGQLETRNSKLEAQVRLDIRGDKDDPFSRGYICPKAAALQ